MGSFSRTASEANAQTHGAEMSGEGTTVSISSGHQMPQLVSLTLDIRSCAAIILRLEGEGVLLSLPGRNKRLLDSLLIGVENRAFARGCVHFPQ